MVGRPGDLASIFGGAVVATLCVVLMVWLFQLDRHERALVAGGHCSKITETLYTPPPTGRTSCHGDGARQYCTTRYDQPDPYMRSLWRCMDPERDGRRVEFWRRTAEETTDER